MSDKKTFGFTTTILHNDRQKPIEQGSLHKPVHTSVAFGYTDARQLASVFQGKEPGFRYGRQGNPTVAALEDKITRMEDGVASICFGTGMAAIGAIFQGLLRAGDHVVSSAFLFGNTNSLWQTVAGQGVGVAFVDATDVANVEAALTPETRLVFVETIANPRTQVADLARIGALCRARGILFVVDNTMTTPFLFRPKAVGAGLVVNSLTKSIGGHGIALGGSLTDTGAYDWNNYPHIAANYKRNAPAQWGMAQIRAKGLRDFGAALGPEAAHHIAVGAETLALRMERSCANALALARMLEADPRVAAVHYPGLASHPAARACGRAVPLVRLAVQLRAEGRHRLLRLPQPPRARHRRQQPRRHPHAGHPGRAHHLFRDGRRTPRQHGHRRIADPGVGRHRRHGRPAGRFPRRAGTRLTPPKEHP